MYNLQAVVSKSINNSKVQLEKLGVIASSLSNYSTYSYKTPRFDTYMLADGRIAGTERYDYRQGSLYKTNQELDVAIDGQGFVPVTCKDGKIAYTRNLSMKTTNEGLLVMGDGSVVGSGIKIPLDSTRISIAPDGKVMSYDSVHKEGYEIGRIPLVKFRNYEGLEQGDFNKVFETKESGEPILISEPQCFSQYYLERSNLNVYDAVNETMRLQANIQLNKTMVKLANEIYQQSISLDQ